MLDATKIESLQPSGRIKHFYDYRKPLRPLPHRAENVALQATEERISGQNPG
jgi:hypothetical protein